MRKLGSGELLLITDLQVEDTIFNASGLDHVAFATLEQALPDEGLAEQEFNVFLCPGFRWQRLQEHHDLLEIHAKQLVRPFDQEGCADIQMEV